MPRRTDLREKLVAAAIEAIDERGLDALSVRDVARRAGVSSGAPFRHFPDKAALLAAVAEDAMRRFEAHTADAVADADDPQAAFQALGIAFVRFAVAHPAHFRVMFLPGLEGHAGLDALREASTARFRGLIVAGQRSGALRPGPPEPIMLSAWAIVYGLARMFTDGILEGVGLDDADPVALATIVTDHLGRGIGVPTESASE